MPCEDGLSWLQQLRRSWPASEVPVIIYSSLDKKEMIRQCYEDGAVYFLPKGQTVGHLARQLINILAQDLRQQPSYYLFYLGKAV